MNRAINISISLGLAITLTGCNWLEKDKPTTPNTPNKPEIEDGSDSEQEQTHFSLSVSKISVKRLSNGNEVIVDLNDATSESLTYAPEETP